MIKSKPDNQEIIITHKPSLELELKAIALANRYGLKYVPLLDLGIEDFLKNNKVDYCLLLTNEKLLVASCDKKYFWHPNTALLKLKAANGGKLVRALTLKKGDSVLDCTAGLASDSLVIANAVGESGSVTALESEKLIYMLSKEGIYNSNYELIKNLRDRIILKNEDYRDYLSNTAVASFDVVYFDPMFEKSKYGSKGIEFLQSYADYLELDIESVNLAKRVARKAVVVKTRFGSNIISSLKSWQLIGERRIGKVVYLCYYFR